MIRLDLKTALPVIAAAYAAGKITPGRCSYSAPCALGVAMTPEERDELRVAGRNSQQIRQLATLELVAFPDPDQLTDAAMLQTAFDGGNRVLFERELERLKEKYPS